MILLLKYLSDLESYFQLYYNCDCQWSPYHHVSLALLQWPSNCSNSHPHFALQTILCHSSDLCELHIWSLNHAVASLYTSDEDKSIIDLRPCNILIFSNILHQSHCASRLLCVVVYVAYCTAPGSIWHILVCVKKAPSFCSIMVHTSMWGSIAPSTPLALQLCWPYFVFCNVSSLFFFIIRRFSPVLTSSWNVLLSPLYQVNLKPCFKSLLSLWTFTWVKYPYYT